MTVAGDSRATTATTATIAPAAPAARGFIIDRADGKEPLPGSLHSNRRLHTWLRLHTPGVVQVRTGKVELGQGILTALHHVAVQELGLQAQQVQMLSATTADGPDEGVTSGSLSVQDSGQAIRHACAQLRGMALEAAARLAGLQPIQVRQRGAGFFSPTHERIGDFWSLLSQADLAQDYAVRYTPRSPAQDDSAARPHLPRLDLHDKVFGLPRFIHDMRWPGMLHARVIRGLLGHARLKSWPLPLSTPLPEDVRTWTDGSFVAVLARSELAVERAAHKLDEVAEWTVSQALPQQDALADFLRSAPKISTVIAQHGEGADAPWPEDGVQHRAAYFKPYLAHASIGTACAVARYEHGQLEVWSHSQSIHNLRDDLAIAFSTHQPPLSKECIVVHHAEGAGCYGHNGADDVAFDAALLALQFPGEAVRVLWSRTDELSQSPMGPAHAVSLHARVNMQGVITHWSHEHWANGYSSRPGRAKVPALLGASQRAAGQPLPDPVNPPLAAGGGAERNAIPAYEFDNLRVTSHRVLQVPLRTSAMRALGAYANVFATESFMDELAHACGSDPLVFRRRHLRDPRTLELLDALVQRSQWWGQRAQEEEGVGHGMAWARYKNKGAWCAVLARVKAEAQLRVLALDIAVDVGSVVDLDGVINQIEGGAIQSVSWTLKEQVRLQTEGIASHGWDTYPILRFSEVPQVTVHVLDRPLEPPLGAGEAAQGPVAAALANALYDAIGVRVRQLPLDLQNITAAMEQQDSPAGP